MKKLFYKLYANLVVLSHYRKIRSFHKDMVHSTKRLERSTNFLNVINASSNHELKSIVPNLEELIEIDKEIIEVAQESIKAERQLVDLFLENLHSKFNKA